MHGELRVATSKRKTKKRSGNKRQPYSSCNFDHNFAAWQRVSVREEVPVRDEVPVRNERWGTRSAEKIDIASLNEERGVAACIDDQ